MSELRLMTEFTAKLPMVPNYILAADGSDRKIAIEELGEDQLRAIGRAWTDALIELAGKRRVAPPQQDQPNAE
jgi:hypothetical protein